MKRPILKLENIINNKEQSHGVADSTAVVVSENSICNIRKGFPLWGIDCRLGLHRSFKTAQDRAIDFSTALLKSRRPNCPFFFSPYFSRGLGTAACATILHSPEILFITIR